MMHLLRRKREVPSHGGEHLAVLSDRELDHLLYACAITILSDRRRSYVPVETERRVDNAIDGVIDVSMVLSRLRGKSRGR